MLAPGALAELVAPLADPAVGGAAGNQVYRHAGGSETGEASYWNLDRLLKRWESAAGSVVSATGALYALRRPLFTPVAEGVTDDFYTSTGVVLQGRRLVFAEQAIAIEPPAATRSGEFRRKARIIHRGLRGVWLRRSLLYPRQYGFYAWQLLSHKVLRRLVALPLIAAAAASAVLAHEHGLYRLAAGAQLGFYALALAGAALASTRLGRLKLFCLPWYFVLVQAASLVALGNLTRGRRLVLWEPQRAPGHATHLPAADNASIAVAAAPIPSSPIAAAGTMTTVSG
jgi:hypothetical protein